MYNFFCVHCLFQRLIEKAWYAVTETCLAFTIFKDDLSPKFIALFTLLLFLKCFHWLAEDRVDYVCSVTVFFFWTCFNFFSVFLDGTYASNIIHISRAHMV